MPVTATTAVPSPGASRRTYAIRRVFDRIARCRVMGPIVPNDRGTAPPRPTPRRATVAAPTTIRPAPHESAAIWRQVTIFAGPMLYATTAPQVNIGALGMRLPVSSITRIAPPPTATIERVSLFGAGVPSMVLVAGAL